MAAPIENWSKIEVRGVVRFLHANGKNPTEIHKHIVATYGDEQKAGEWSTPFVQLIACGTADHMCDILVEVVDTFMAITTCTLTVKVEPFSVLSPEATEKEALDSVAQVVETLDEKLHATSKMNNPLQTAQEAATYANIVGSMESGVKEKEEFTTFNVDNMTVQQGLPEILDPYTLPNPVESTLTQAVGKYVDQISTSVTSATDRGMISKPDDVQIFAETMTTALSSSKKSVDGDSLFKASNVAATLSDILTRQTAESRVSREVEDAQNGIANLLDDLIDSMAIDVRSLEPDAAQLGTDTKMDGQEIDYIATMLSKRRKYKVHERLEKAESITLNIQQTWDSLFDVERKLVYDNGQYRVQKHTFSMEAQQLEGRNTVRDIQETGKSRTVAGFYFQGLSSEITENDLTAQVVKSENVFIHGKHSKYITANIVYASIVNSAGQKLHMVAPSFEHAVADDCSADNLVRVEPKFVNEDAAKLFYHKFEIMDPNAATCVKIRPTDSSLIYRLYAKAGSPPSDVSYDYRKTIPRSRMTGCEEVCIPGKKLTKAGDAYIGLRPLQDTTVQTRRKKRAANAIDPLVAPYFFGLAVVACYTWDNKEVDWLASKCQMTKRPGNVTCICGDGQEVINGLGFSFAPNTINFATVFSKFDIENQASVLATLLVIYAVFMVISAWAHYMDRKAILKWGVFPLMDNYAEDSYYYLLTVITGMRRSAGTKSKVHFCLAGEVEETGVRVLSDGIREGFPMSSVVHLMMAVPDSLGPLQCLRVWHDNSGPGRDASWFLDRVDVIDMQTGSDYHFVCGEWMSPEHNSLDKVLQSSSREELEKFQSLFLSNVQQKVTDEHLWVSVFLRPERSRFTRVERVGCCLVFLVLAMITSAMFYEGAPDNDRQQPPADLEIGPIRLSYHQLGISLVSAIITAIPIILIVTIFRSSRTVPHESDGSCCRKSRYRRKKVVSEKEAMNAEVWAAWTVQSSENKDTLEENAKDATVQAREQEKSAKGGTRKTEVKTPITKCCAKFPWMIKLERQMEELQKMLMVSRGEEDVKGTWPHYWRYLAWALIFLCVCVCSFFILLYSMEWGKDVTEEWLSTFFLSFLQSMFVVDPSKVVVLSLFFSIFMRKANVRAVDETNLALVDSVNKEYGIKEKPLLARQYISYESALTEEELRAATQKRKIQVFVWNTLRELLTHIFLLIIICSLCYSDKNEHDYQMHKMVYTSLVDGKYDGFKYVNTTADYFTWLENVVTAFLFPEKNYLGESIISEDRQYTALWDLYRLGAPRLRQLRMPSEECESHEVSVPKCVHEYSISDEETKEYCFGWTNTPCPQIDQLRVTAEAWHFQSAIKIWGLPIAGEFNSYGGGGYIVNLDINVLVAKTILRELKESLWINKGTRATFLEFTLYCPNMNRFAYVIILTEFPETGGILRYVSVHPFQVHNPPGALGTYMSLCEILGIAFTAVGVVYAMYIFSQERLQAFKNFWFMVDLSAVIVALVAISVFSARLRFTDMALEKMRADETKFVNFYHVVVWDTAYTFCLALLVVIFSFRLLKLAGYSKRTIRVYEVLKLSAGILPNFFLYISMILMSFAVAGCLLFGRTSPEFRSLMHTLETLFTGILGHTGFKETNLPETEGWVTILFFCIFVVVVVLFLTNLFLAILLDILTVNAQRDCEAVTSDQAQIFQIMWDSFLKAMGRNRDPVARLKQDVVKPARQEEDIVENYEHLLSRLGMRFQKDSNMSVVDTWKQSLSDSDPLKKQEFSSMRFQSLQGRGRLDPRLGLPRESSFAGASWMGELEDEQGRTDQASRLSEGVETLSRRLMREETDVNAVRRHSIPGTVTPTDVDMISQKY